MQPSVLLVPTPSTPHPNAHRSGPHPRLVSRDGVRDARWSPPEPLQPPRTDSPWLCWQTGSLALVSLAAMDGDPLGTPTWRRPLGASAEQVLEQLAALAPTLGWSVFARLRPRRKGEVWLVLGPQPETTAVIQRDAHSPIALPLTLQLVATGIDRCEVRLHDGATLAQRGLPDDLLRRVATLPTLILRLAR